MFSALIDLKILALTNYGQRNLQNISGLKKFNKEEMLSIIFLLEILELHKNFWMT